MSKRRVRFLLCALALAFTACGLSPLPDLPSTSSDDAAGDPGTGGISIGTGGTFGAGGSPTGAPQGGASLGGEGGGFAGASDAEDVQ